MKKYRMHDVIGDGTYGTVYKGTCIESGETVAIKKLKNKIKNWNECVELKEVKALSKLKAHPNIIKLKEIIRETNSEVFLVFEFADTNLYEYIESVKKRAERIPENKIKDIIYQIANGLCYTHQNGYFHRDLKPENILLLDNSSGNTIVKIADFGLAREIPSYYNNIPLTDYVCTRWYRPPECVLKSTNYSSAMDIWALGCIMAELYMLNPIFPGNSEFDQLNKVVNIIGAPKFNEWPEGYKLIQKLGMKFSNSTGVHLSTLMSNASIQGINLLYEILHWDPIIRPNCMKLMSNPYFEEIKFKNNNFFESYHTRNPLVSNYNHDSIYVNPHNNNNSSNPYINSFLNNNNNTNEDYMNNFNYKIYKNNNNFIPEISTNNPYNSSIYNISNNMNTFTTKSKLSYLAENDMKFNNNINKKTNSILNGNNYNYNTNKNDLYQNNYNNNTTNFNYEVKPSVPVISQKNSFKSDIENQINNISYQRQGLFNYPQIFI